MTITSNPTFQEAKWFIGRARSPRIRSMLEFAEQEIVIPDGPHRGRRFRGQTQPFTRLWYDAVGSGKWNRFAALGPVQSGKTLNCYVIPALYHLFEYQETVILGIPTMDMAADKWSQDILPAIEQSRYRDQMPTRGEGSRGGRTESIRFRNGVTLRFMSGGGRDSKRSGFTARVLVVTEVDKMDEAGDASREADKITQMEARTRAFGSRNRIYLECSVSIETGRIHQEFLHGTQSRIIRPCPHCRHWVTPEREHFHGFEEAKTESEAKQQAAFFCPDCGEQWTEQERRQANALAKLLHRGQEVTEAGEIVGPDPPTDTLGFRWTAADNHFATAADLGLDEWKAKRAVDEDNAEKALKQFVWTIPHEPSQSDLTGLDEQIVSQRIAHGLRRGIVPADTRYVTVGGDLRRRELHWSCSAWQPDGSPIKADYGVLPVPSDHMPLETALLLTLRKLRDEICEVGWEWAGHGTARRKPDQVWIDASWNPCEVVYVFVRESDVARYRPVKGYGFGQQHHQWYNRPKTTGATVKHIGEEYHIAAQPAHHVLLVEINSDYWKSWVHNRLRTPLGQPGAMLLFEPSEDKTHRELAKHLTAEKQIEENLPERGPVVKWVNERSRPNHWLDTTYYECAAGHFCGVRLVDAPKPVAHRPLPQRPRLTTPDGRPFLITERT